MFILFFSRQLLQLHRIPSKRRYKTQISLKSLLLVFHLVSQEIRLPHLRSKLFPLSYRSFCLEFLKETLLSTSFFKKSFVQIYFRNFRNFQLVSSIQNFLLQNFLLPRIKLYTLSSFFHFFISLYLLLFLCFRFKLVKLNKPWSFNFFRFFLPTSTFSLSFLNKRFQSILWFLYNLY